MASIALRPMTPEDGEELVKLSLMSPDTGQFQIAPRHHLDAYQAAQALHPDTVGVVAVTAGSGEIAGSGFVRFGRRTYEGEVRDCAWLYGLQVHPAYRRQGIATRLAEWRVACARERVGEDGVVVASIQKGNEGSFAVAERWCRELVGELVTGAVNVRTKPPRSPEGSVVRQAGEGDLEAIVAGLNAFYADYNFYTPHTAASLAEWLARTPFSDPIRRYFVVEDGAGNIVAGMGVAEEHRIMEMEVQGLPVLLRLLNRAVKFVPAEGRIRQLSAVKAWFAPGQMAAGQQLWETLRWEQRERGNMLGFSFDARSPLKKVFRKPLWVPTMRLTLAVSGPTLIGDSNTRLIYGG